MIKRLIRAIRRKPKGVRDNIALSIAGSFTAVVFMVWLYHMPARNAALVELQNDDSSPGFFKMFQGVEGQISAVKEAVKGEAEPVSEGTLRNAERKIENEPAFYGFIEASSSVATTTTSTYSGTTSDATDSSTSSVGINETKTTPTVVSPPREVRIVTVPDVGENSSTTAPNE
ncbi:hypothetical protein KC865_02480 [Candidatus Kaiserbacteria bacterium]|nr:hypothetical protein [Candidatus Kaiserbacteria bacterium]USN92246.1 MAG: hypothetical protein H6782_00255 [Candidatus Nomurabacteria bacterium]